MATAGTCGTRKASAPAPIVSTASSHSRLKITRPGSTSGSIGVVRASARRRRMPSVTFIRRPTKMPTSVAAPHQPSEK